MKKTATFLVLFLLLGNCVIAQAPKVSTNKILVSPTKLKLGMPFLAKGSPTFKQLVNNNTNPTFKMVRGVVAAKRNETNAQTSEQPDATGRYCTSVQVSEEKGDQKKIVLGNQNDKIYPGAIYNDDAFITGDYKPVVLPLAPYEITTDLFSAASSGSSIVNVQPGLGGVNDGIATLMRNNARVRNPSRISVEVKSMNSSEQLAFEIGANFEGYGAELEASFSMMKRTSKNVFIARLTQVYFSVMLNRPNGYSLLTNTANLPVSLVYVNKVNYGRLGYLMIASDSSEEQIQAALDFTYSSGSVSAGANARLNYDRTLSNMQISGFFFGGDAANSVRINSSNKLQDFDDYVQNGLVLDPNVAPVAMSYELKYLNDNATAATRSTTSYTERICSPSKGLKIQLHNVAIEDVHGGDCSYAWGKIEVEVWECNINKQPVKQLWGETLWSYNAANPNRTVINYADVKNNANIREDVINLPGTTKYLTLNPSLVNDNKIMLRFKLNINTRHKDNDFAALGQHGMNRVEVVDKLLSEVFVPSDNIGADPNRYKLGTFKAGKFCSNTDRVHCFYAFFTVTNNL